MPPKDYTLRRVREFNLLKQHGRWIRGQYFDLKVLSIRQIPAARRGAGAKNNPQPTELKIGLAVSAKAAPGAVRRNRLKRRWREIIRSELAAGLVPGHFLLFVARPAAAKQPFSALVSDTAALLRRAGVARFTLPNHHHQAP